MEPFSYTKYRDSVSTTGDYRKAYALLVFYGQVKRWQQETIRARWDGAKALLDWWHTLSPVTRPALAQVVPQDLAGFLSFLAARNLTASTFKAYVIGAKALLRVIKVHPREASTYDPFKGLKSLKEHTARAKRVYDLSEAQLASLKLPKAKEVKLRLLIALVNLGMTIPEVCSRTWANLILAEQFLEGYHQRQLRLGQQAQFALQQFKKYYPPQKSFYQLIPWSAETARKWVKRVRLVMEADKELEGKKV